MASLITHHDLVPRQEVTGVGVGNNQSVYWVSTPLGHEVIESDVFWVIHNDTALPELVHRAEVTVGDTKVERKGW